MGSRRYPNVTVPAALVWSLFSLQACTLFSDTGVPTRTLASVYEACAESSVACEEGMDCILIEHDGTEVTRYCAPVCAVDEDCLSLGAIPARCALAAPGTSDPDRCVLSCDGGTACPAGMACEEVEGLSICVR